MPMSGRIAAIVAAKSKARCASSVRKIRTMNVLPTDLPGVLVIEPKVFGDSRGFFFEVWREDRYAPHGIGPRFVQDNHSKSSHGTLRGLHLQLEHAQGKLVRVLAGEIYDVAVDVCVGSPTFGKYTALTLSAENRRQLWVPPNYAHGFVVTSAEAEVEYKCTDYYHPASEVSVLWNDPAIGIPWPVTNPLLSAKDAQALTLANAAAAGKLPRWSGNLR
jgi:dTDP-4-dehydrorhamnose 3,5-epimerase